MVWIWNITPFSRCWTPSSQLLGCFPEREACLKKYVTGGGPLGECHLQLLPAVTFASLSATQWTLLHSMFLLPLSPACAHRTKQMGIKPSNSRGQTSVCFCWVFGHSDGKEPAHRVHTKTSYTADSMGTEACCFSADRNSLFINRIWEKWEVVFLTHTITSTHFPSLSVHRLSSSRQDISISVNLKHQPRGLYHSCCCEIHVAVNGKNYKKTSPAERFYGMPFFEMAEGSFNWSRHLFTDVPTFL